MIPFIRTNNLREQTTMYRLEKIGHLILITLEGDLNDTDIANIKGELTKMADVDDEVVVSLNVAGSDGSPRAPDSSEETNYNHIVNFCIEQDIRLYSYIYE